METKDGVTFIVAGTITYRVPDLMALVPTTHSPAATVLELAATAVHDTCCDYEWVELQEAQRRGTLKTVLRKDAQKQLGEYGIEVIKVQLTSLARTRAFKLFQSTANDEN